MVQHYDQNKKEVNRPGSYAKTGTKQKSQIWQMTAQIIPRKYYFKPNISFNFPAFSERVNCKKTGTKQLLNTSIDK